MKKIMTITCGAMLALAGLAAPTATPCCGSTGETSCQIWFKGTGTGKISTGVKDQTYKTVKGLKIKSCILVIGDDSESNRTAVVRITGTKTKVGDFTQELVCSEFTWNIFGKNIDKALAGSKKELSLESEIYFKAADEDETTQVCGVLFGTVKAKSTGTGCTPCGDVGGIKYTPVKFVGKYVGFAPATGCQCATELTYELGEGSCSDKSCLEFVEPEGDQQEYFCGDIVLKYDSKNSGYKAR